MSRKITNDCFIFNGCRSVCVLCEMMMMMVDRCCLFVCLLWMIFVIDFVRCECEQGSRCEFSAVLEKRTFQVPPRTYLSYRSESTVVLR